MQVNHASLFTGRIVHARRVTKGEYRIRIDPLFKAQHPPQADEPLLAVPFSFQLDAFSSAEGSRLTAHQLNTLPAGVPDPSLNS
ncbi:MAG: hypothetical protein JJV98_18460 [Desulfosarcina sp.]|nr:hypothetical protein [Desulfobacterales bacterium]